MEYKNYISVALAWDYINTLVTLFMPNYITTELHKFQHGIPSAPENSPHIHVKPLYSAKIQYAHDPNSYLCLQEKYFAIIQKILGNFLYYGIGMGNTILPTLSDLASENSCSTKRTAQKITKLLNYLATNPVANL